MEPPFFEDYRLDSYQRSSVYPPFGVFAKKRSSESEDESRLEEYWQKRGITVQGKRHPGSSIIPPPIVCLSDPRLSEFPASVKASVPRPTPLQAQVWPMALMHQDLIGIDKTGSRKTLAYLWPAAAAISFSSAAPGEGDGPMVLILAPEPEDLEKIQQECSEFGPSSRFKTSIVHEWAPPDDGMEKGAPILIATPGGLELMLRSGRANLSRVTYLALDDVDRMLDNKPEPWIKNIVDKVSPDCQKLFFSATWPKKCDDLARLICSKHKFSVVVGFPTFEVWSCGPQKVELVAEDEKRIKLLDILKNQYSSCRALVFMDGKRGMPYIHEIASSLNTLGSRTTWIDDSRSPAGAMEFFSQGCLFSTLIATHGHAHELLRLYRDEIRNSAGKDKDANLIVINYDFPQSLDDYIYVKEMTGKMIPTHTFFAAANARFAKELISILRKSEHPVSHELEALGLDAPHSEKVSIQKMNVGQCNSEDDLENFYDLQDCCGNDRPICVNYPRIENKLCFAVKEVNEKKNVELHLVRVLEANETFCCDRTCRLYLTFEVVDATSKVKEWQVKACLAVLEIDYRLLEDTCVHPRMQTKLFVLVDHDGVLSTLIDIEEGREWRTI